MIERLKQKHLTDVYEFLSRVNDKNEDFYITINKERKFLRGNWSLIKKVLKYKEVYGLFDRELKGIMIILRDKGFRPYLKLLTEDKETCLNLLRFLRWNFIETELYCKFKKDNPLSYLINRAGFIKIGNRGAETLFLKKGVKQLQKVRPKDSREDKHD